MNNLVTVNIQNPNSPENLINRIQYAESEVNSALSWIDTYEIRFEANPTDDNKRMIKYYQEQLVNNLAVLKVLGQRLAKVDGQEVEVQRIIDTYQNIIDTSSQNLLAS